MLMATFPKISDNEMDYFQFKARQMLLLKKEDKEWQKLCKQTAPECLACSAEKEKAELNVTKNAGIQVSPKKSFNKIGEGKPIQSRYKQDLVPVTLKDIKTKLDNIDLALSKMYDTSNTKLKEQKYESIILPHSSASVPDLKSHEEKRKLLIQKSLTDSLQRIQQCNIMLEKPKKPPPSIKMKNCGYFLPHDLQQKRAAARKAYLASLKNKPKVEVPNALKNKKKIQDTQKTMSDKPTAKSGKKVISKPKSAESNQDIIPSLVESAELGETEDENIERVVDGILDDLLGEAVLDLNKIKLGKGDKTIHFKRDMGEDKTKLSKNISDLPAIKTVTMPTVNANEQLKLRLFWNSSENLPEKQQDNKEIYLDNKESMVLNANVKKVLDEPDSNTGECSFKTPQMKKFYEIKDPPKFVCGISHIISVDPDKAKQISLNRERFWEYLKSISRIENGNFNPWVICNMVAEAILDDCIHDISEELGDIPSSLIKELYNQEFMHQVEF